MIKKKFLPVRSSDSSPYLSKPAQPSKSKQALPLEKKPSDSSLENIYRLPSSLKRTEDMINKSILQRQISSKILDIVGSTFRVKNATPNQGRYFCSPTNFTQFLKYKEYASSEFLDTLYEVEGEETSEDSLQTETTNEISTLSICIEQTRRAEDVSSSILSKTSHGSFLEALDKITNQSTAQEKRSYSSLLLDDPKSARMSSSTSRSNCRDSDPWKQIKEAIASKKMTYSLVENVSKQKKVETSNVKRIKKEKELQVSTIQRELERDVKRLENRVKRLREKENLLIKNKINGKTKQDSTVCQEEAEKEDILNVKIYKEQASLEGHKFEGNNISIQEDIGEDISNRSKESTIKIQPSKNLINPTANHEILRKSLGSYQIKSELLEPRRRTELDVKTKTLGNRKE